MKIEEHQQQILMNKSEPLDLGEAKPLSGSQTFSETTSTTDPIIVWPPAFCLKTLNGKYLRGWSGMIKCFEWDPKWDDCHRTFQVKDLKDNFVGIINTFEIHEGIYGHRENTYNTISGGEAIIKDNSYKFHYNSLGGNNIALKCDNGLFWTIADNSYIEAASSKINEKTTFVVEETNVIRKEYTSVVYDIDHASAKEVTPLTTLSTLVTNTSDTTITKELAFTYTKSIEGTWNNEVGITVGMAAEVSCSVPFFGEGKISVNTSVTASHQWGGSQGITKEITDSTSVEVPPHTEMEVEVLILQELIDVKFTYETHRLLADGTVNIEKALTGVYTNVDSYKSVVKVLNQKPC